MTSLANRYREVKSIYNGVVPIFKPAGVSSNDIIKFMYYDVNYYINTDRLAHLRPKIKLSYGSPLEPFASGVLTLFLGKSSKSLGPAFSNAKHIYKARVKFGEQRDSGCLDGTIIGESSYDHLSEKLITNQVVKYLGIIKQEYPYPVFDRLIFDVNESTLDYFDQRKKRKILQRYPLMTKRDRLVECYKLDLVNISLPYADFFISCSGTFSVRQFFTDLSKELSTFVSLIELLRLQEGPFFLDNVTTQTYHLHYEILSKRLTSNESLRENVCMNEYMSDCIKQAV